MKPFQPHRLLRQRDAMTIAAAFWPRRHRFLPRGVDRQRFAACDFFWRLLDGRKSRSENGGRTWSCRAAATARNLRGRTRARFGVMRGCVRASAEQALQLAFCDELEAAHAAQE